MAEPEAAVARSTSPFPRRAAPTRDARHGQRRGRLGQWAQGLVEGAESGPSVHADSRPGARAPARRASPRRRRSGGRVPAGRSPRDARIFKMARAGRAADDRPTPERLLPVPPAPSQVYDITDFAKSHPGGSQLLALAVGRDATILFESHRPPEIVAKTLKTLPKVTRTSTCAPTRTSRSPGLSHLPPHPAARARRDHGAA